MSLVTNSIDELTNYATENDVCYLCAKEYAQEMKVGKIEAFKDLIGKLLNKNVLKIKHSGEIIVLCEDHIRKFIKTIERTKNAETKDC